MARFALPSPAFSACDGPGQTERNRPSIRRKHRVRLAVEVLEDRVTPATLAGLATLPSAFVTDGPIVSDLGVAYAAYTNVDTSNGILGGVVRILPDGTLDPNFATFLASAQDGSPGSQLIGNPNTAGFALYGSTYGGGSLGYGSVYSLDATGNITTLGSFDYTTTGYGPGDLVLDDGVLYGTCYGGGANNFGTVFSLPADGGTPTLIATFNGTNGQAPSDGLCLSDGVLYGTTYNGGSSGGGTVFSVPAGGGAITVLANLPAGSIASGHVVVMNGYVIGTLGQSDASTYGALFRTPITPGGLLQTVPFGANLATGQYPGGGLTDDGGILIGETGAGGAEGVGTVFEVDPSNFTVATVADFPHHGTPGTLPFGTLTVDSQGNVYGVAHGEQGQGNYQAVYWKLSGLGDNAGGGGGSEPPANLAAPKMRPPSKRSTVVNNTEPTFKWTPVKGATSYELLVTDITPGIRDELAKALDQTVTGTSYTPMYTLNPAHYYEVEVRAIDSAGEPGPWSNAPHFKIAEQKTRYYRIRLDSSFEASDRAAGGIFNFTIQALEDSKNREALGPPRLMTFTGLGTGVPTPLPVGFSGTSTWDDFTLPKAMTVDSLAGPGVMTLPPSATFGSAGFSSPTELVFLKPGEQIKDSLNVNSVSVGINVLTIYGGKWRVEKAPHYDLTLWPNTLTP
jgi:uncharacterized repeat protein (TIGR03803 family)